MSYPNGEGGLPFPQSRTGSISYAGGASSQGLNYFSNGSGSSQQQQQQQQRSHDTPPHVFPMPQHVSWPSMASSHAGSSAPSTSTAQQASSTGNAPGASSSAANSIIVDSPAESRSDTEEPAARSASTGAHGSSSHSGKRKGTEDPEGSSGPRNKKKRNRAVLSCAPCKSRKVSRHVLSTASILPADQTYLTAHRSVAIGKSLLT